MAFNILYHEDSLADLTEIFDWSRENHPEATEEFANDLFDYIELLHALPYIGTPVKRSPILKAPLGATRASSLYPRKHTTQHKQECLCHNENLRD